MDMDEETQQDAMNDYMEASNIKTIDFMDPEVSPVEFMNMGAIPKKPLHHTVDTFSLGKNVQSQPSPHTPIKQYKPSRVRVTDQLSHSHETHDNLSTVVKGQGNIADLIIMQQKLALLPARDITAFDGDPLQYQVFIKAFEHVIEDKTSSSQDRLYFLEQYTLGQPRSLVRSCLHMDARHGYVEAKRLLKEHFGDEIKITNAYLEKALNWTSVRADDGKGLHAYALYLRGCCNAMRSLQYMEELDMPSNLRSILSKLPYKLRERWRTTAYETLQRTKARARFHHLVEFMERQAKILLDPLFGDIQDHNPPSRRIVTKSQAVILKSPKNRGSSFATIVNPSNDEDSTAPSNTQSWTFKQQPQCINPASSCNFCKAKHALIDCPKFKAHPHKEKVDFLKINGYCFGCLLRGHMSKNCRRRLTCDRCQKTHPTILHIEYIENANNISHQPTSSPAERSVNSALVSAGETTGAGRDLALAIVPVKIKVDKGNKFISTYAFLDPGSSASFCTENLMRQLSPKARRTTILLRTMGQERPVRTYEISGLEISHLDGSTYLDLPKVYTQAKIPVSKENIPTKKDLEKWPYLSRIQLDEIDADIELLIGIDVPKAMEPWEIINSKGNGPYAVKTLFGWVVNGPLSSCPAVEPGPSVVTANRISVSNLKDLLLTQYNHDFCEKEYDEKEETSDEDKRFMTMARNSFVLKNGHYQLPLPFRDTDTVMPDNYAVAQQRTLNLLRKFKRDAGYAMEYKRFMTDVLEKGYAEKVPLEQLHRKDGQVWHIPHHGVYHQQKGNLRVVFDCAASFKGTSLNQVLLQGPNLTNTLIGVLLRFRQEQIAFMADIESMFYRVQVQEHHRDFLRFLCWPGGDTNKPLESYRMNVHLFGAVSSPSIANFALRQTAEDNSHRYDKEVTQTIRNNFYVDDCLMSTATVEEATKLISDLREACAQGSFSLTKWVSNSREVLASIPEHHKAKQFKELDLDKDKLPIERALGIEWNTESDSFAIKVAIKVRALTRRGILSMVSSIYDPLGFLSPFTLKAKQILQGLCKVKSGWDQIIPEDFSKQWQRWITELEQLSRFQVDRRMKPEDFGPIRTAQLHHFSDASELGYGTVSYLRFTNTAGRIHVVFVLGKSRVTPLKQITIPRLELTAATLAVKTDRMLKRELQQDLEDSVFWTDSTAVLGYIHNKRRRYHTFVANRVSLICELSQDKQWRHVNSKDNPADDASRGLNIEPFLESVRWLKGPQFLEKEDTDWPEIPERLGQIPPDDPEVKKEVSVNIVSVDTNPTSMLIEYYSSWNRLKRGIAWMLRIRALLILLRDRSPELTKFKSLKERMKHLKMEARAQELSVEDIREAEKSIIRFEQRRFLPQDFAHLEKGMQVKASSSICKLNPTLDEGMLRVGGRISRLAMPLEMKNPIILPKGSRISMLVLLDIHQRVGHSGRSHMLSTLNQRYWLPSANSSARKIIKSCVFCRRMQAAAGEQKMADLPKDRVSPDLPPFTHVGIDYFGPINVKRGRAHVKRWGVIFTFLVSRAVHLEVADYLDTDSCINALRRFICRRGPVTSIRTDNGTNFVGAQKELQKSLKEMCHHRIQNALLKEGVKWAFNPPFGAHFGGVWERLIKPVKKILHSVLKEQVLDDETLQTALCEVESIMNDRPLTTISSDPNDLEPLTPNHLLQLKAKPVMPPGLSKKDDLYSRRRWKQAQYLADLFWKRWVREYLPIMQQRSKWHSPKRNLRPDDLVIIVDDTAPRSSWLMGRVVKALPGPGGLVRSVVVKTKSSILQRPIDKLCLLLEAGD